MIREAKKEDLELVSDMWYKCMQTTLRPFSKCDEEEKRKFYLHAVKDFERADRLFLMCGDSGFLKANLVFPDYGSYVLAHVECLYIDPDKRGKGYLELLLSGCKVWAYAVGAEYITFDTIYNDTLPKIWRRKEGAEPVGIAYCVEV
jgi:N-acetylglutamate synthase-like GNAT family acetyltransferase